jgi:polymorphic membrane protein
VRRPAWLLAVLLLAGCGAPSPAPAPAPDPSTVDSSTSVEGPPAPLPSPGNVDGGAPVPPEAGPVDTSHPDRVIGDGTPASCTSDAVVAAVAAGGIITFHCGPAPVTITMTATAKVVNAHGPDIVLDGGGRVTLSGGGAHRILYMNTCDKAQGWTTSHCQDQDTPRLTVQNLAFVDGDSTGETAEGGGGGAIFVRGGRFKVVNSRFERNHCEEVGPDLGGAAIRVLSQYHGEPVYVVNATFDGGVCANGGALSSIGVSWIVLNSVFTNNRAVGHGANPAKAGTPGGGSGGAIYLDGNLFTLRLAGTVITGNHAVEGGGAVFFVSNDRTGTMAIESSTLRDNPNEGFATRGLPGIFFLGARTPTITNSTLT